MKIERRETLHAELTNEELHEIVRKHLIQREGVDLELDEVTHRYDEATESTITVFTFVVPPEQ